MLKLLLAFVMTQAAAAKTTADQFLPYLNTIAVAAILLDRIKNRGKKEGVDETTVNDFGARVGKVEAANKVFEGQFSEHQRQLAEVLAQNGQLLREIGHAEKGADQCREDTEKFAINIGVKVDEMRRELSGKIGDLTVQLEGVKTEVRLRAQFGERDRRGP